VIHAEFLFDTALHNRSLERQARSILQKASRLARVKNTDIDVTITNDARMKKLNNAYRGKRTSTDVLSFAMRESKPFPRIRCSREHLGDIFINVNEIKRRAKKLRVSQKDIFLFLLVHGFLHLAGFDHMKTGEERRMRALEHTICEGRVFYDHP